MVGDIIKSYKQKYSVRYSISFKEEVVSEVIEGKLPKRRIAAKYGISLNTLYRWIKKYSNFEGVIKPQITVQMPEEKEEIKMLKAKIQELEARLKELALDYLEERAEKEILMEDYGVSEEELKKKLAERRRK